MKKNYKRFLSLLLITTLMMSNIILASEHEVTVRIEGLSNTLYEETITITDEETGDELLDTALGDDITFTDSTYGKYITEVLGETGASNYSYYWGVYTRKNLQGIEMSSVGISNIEVDDIDELLVHMVGSSTSIPTLTCDYDQTSSAALTVYTSSYDWTTYTSTTSTVEGATIEIGDDTYITDSNGQADVDLGEGTYVVKISKEGLTTADLVRERIYLNTTASAITIDGLTDDETVNSNTITFTVEGTVESVTVNDEEILGEDGSYTASLTEDTNTISILGYNDDYQLDTTSYTLYLDTEYEENIEAIIELLSEEYISYESISSSDYCKFAGLNIINGIDYLSYKKDQIIEMYNDFSPTSYIGTEYFKALSMVVAADIDPTDVDGNDLIENFTTNTIDDITSQGTNGAIYALIALDIVDADLPSDTNITREELIDSILDSQNESGGWNYDGSNGIDLGGTALIALSPYYNTDTDVKDAVDLFATWISEEIQQDDGSIYDPPSVSWGTEYNSPAAAQAILGLMANGYDPRGELFTKTDGDLITYLLSFYDEDEQAFSYTVSSDVDTSFSTPQCYAALTAYLGFLENGDACNIYDYASSDVIDDLLEAYTFDIYPVYTSNNDYTDKLVADEYFNTDITVINNSDSSEDGFLAVVLYDEDGSIVSVSYVKLSVEGNSEGTYGAGFNLPEDIDSYTVKTFIWDGDSIFDTNGDALTRYKIID